MPRTRMLFFGEAMTLAHVVRPLVLANSLPQSNYEVHFACADFFDSLVSNFPENRWKLNSRSPTDLLKVLQYGKALFDETLLARYVEEDLRLIDKTKPDLIVGDMRQSLSVSAKVAGVPYVSLCNAYWSPWAEPIEFPLPSYRFVRKFGLQNRVPQFVNKYRRSIYEKYVLPRMFRLQETGLNNLRKRYGLLPFDFYLEGFIFGDRTLFMDTPAVAPVTKLLPTQSYIGPVVWSPNIDLPSWWNEIPTDMPIAYVSLGSSGPAELLPAIVSELAKLGIFSLVASANSSTAVTQLPLCRSATYLDGNVASKLATFVVTNGGSPSNYQALVHAKPLLGIPSNMDQLVSMAHIEQSGAGLSIRSDCFNVEDFSRTVKKLLEGASYHKSARLISNEFSQYPSSSFFLSAINELLIVSPKEDKAYRRYAHE